MAANCSPRAKPKSWVFCLGGVWVVVWCGGIGGWGGAGLEV